MIPATVTVDIPPDRAELVLRLVERARESRLPLKAEEGAYVAELSACLELLAGVRRQRGSRRCGKRFTEEPRRNA